MAQLCFLKRDKEITRLKDCPLVKRAGLYINYRLLPGPGRVQVAIRIGRCHKKAVERNKIRRWIKELLREWVKKYPDLLHGKDLSLLINVGVKDKKLDFTYIRDNLLLLLEEVTS